MRGPNGQPLTYRELADTLVDYVKRMGYTHIELLPDHGASVLPAPGATR